MNVLYLAWQDPRSRDWFPIGRLRRINGSYEFAYTQGAQMAALAKPLEAFPDWETVYEAEELFPLFANRVPTSSRPDYAEITRWLDLTPGEADPMVFLASSGGERATDTLEVFARPEPGADGRYLIRFFAHGLRHLPPSSQECVAKLKPDDPLVLMHDFQNEHDPNALLLRTKDKHAVGYCPRYLASDILRLLRENPELPVVSVKRVNDASSPLQWRLLCSLTAEWPADWEPFSGEEFQPIP